MQFIVFRLKPLPERLLQRTTLDQGDELVSCKLAFANFVFSKSVIHGTDSKLTVFQRNYLKSML